MIIKLDLNKNFKDLDGLVLCDDAEGKFPIFMCKIVAHRMSIDPNPFDAFKFFDWSISLHGKNSIEVNEADYLKLKEWVSNLVNLSVLVKVPIVRSLEADFEAAVVASKKEVKVKNK